MRQQLWRFGLFALATTVASAAFLDRAAFAGDTGRLRVTQPDQTASLNSGGSGTMFSVVPPERARCAGDSEHDGYFVFSYLVPKGVDPRSVSFVHIAPSRGFGLRTPSHYYGGVTTEPNTGRLQQAPPNFLWARLSPAQLIPDGQDHATWEGGLACENAATAAVTSTWNFEIVFHRDPSDPRGFAWTVANHATTSTGGSGWLVGVVLGALVAAGGGFYAWSRRHSSNFGETVETVRQPSQNIVEARRYFRAEDRY